MNNEQFVVHTGDNLPILREMADNSVDAIVTDPPYGLSFMGKRWDYDVPSVELWAECLRVLKPGGHLLAFAGTRTQHRMAVRIEDAGFEIRDMIAWVYGSGFPKSLDVSKAIDKAAGAERECTRAGVVKRDGYGEDWDTGSSHHRPRFDAPATDAAKQWDGWGTGLKPSLEPITLARKPLAEHTVAANVLEWGTGGVNVDGCRVGTEVLPAQVRGVTRMGTFEGADGNETPERAGRFPANFIHDGSDEVVGLFPVTGASKASNRGLQHSGRHGGLADIGGNIKKGTDTIRGHDDQGGSAARFFYCAKASRSEREAGLEELEAKRKVFNGQSGHSAGMAPGSVEDKFTTTPSANFHPTVKPIALMRYLCRLVTPPGGIVLDPFTGSGTTGCAAMLEGFRFIGIEREEQYVEIAQKRIEYWRQVAGHAPPSAEQAQMTLLDMQDE